MCLFRPTFLDRFRVSRIEGDRVGSSGFASNGSNASLETTRTRKVLYSLLIDSRTVPI